MLIVLWECRSLWWATGAAAGLVSRASGFFPCRFQRAYLGVVELSSQPKYALVPYHAIVIMSSALGKSRPDSYAVT